MAPLVLLICWLALASAVARRWPAAGWRQVLVVSALGWCALLVLLTEALGALGALTAPAVLTAWCVLSLGAAALALRPPGQRTPAQRQPLPPHRVRSVLARWWPWMVLPSLLLLSVGCVALLAPPNSWDAMTYHLPRVEQWQARRSVDFYPTNIVRQLMLVPLSGYVQLHVRLLEQGDTLANLPQWFTYAGCGVLASLVARELGADGPGQAFSGICVLTIPMAVVEGSSVQTDVMTALWVLASAWAALRILRKEATRPDATLPDAVLLGTAAGLALLSKGSALFLVPPLMVLVAGVELRRRGHRALGPLVAALTVVLVLTGPQMLRTWRVFGSPLASPRVVRSEDVSVGGAVSGLVRNVALHAVMPSDAANAALTHALRSSLEALGLAPDDPRSTLPGTRFVVERPGPLSEWASHPLHGVLLFVALLVALRHRREPSRMGWACWAYAALLAAGFLAFCTLLRWQPTQARLHLPFLAAAMPLVGGALRGRSHRGQEASWLLGVSWLLGLIALGVAVHNPLRPLLGPHTLWSEPRSAWRFAIWPEVRSAYARAASTAAREHCGRIGFIITGDAWEYPLWELTREAGLEGVQVLHLGIRNPSAALPELPGPPPCMVVLADFARTRLEGAPLQWTGPRSTGEVHHAGLAYGLTWSEPPLEVFLPRTPGAPP